MDQPIRIAVLGAGFWSAFQIAAWQELPGAEVVGIYNRDVRKAHAAASRFGIPTVNGDPEALIREVAPDVVDIVTSSATHPEMVHTAAQFGRPVICQKPMADSLELAEAMVRGCEALSVPLFVHENFRWQRPIRRFRDVVASGVIGKPFRARLTFSSAFPVFDNQPFLREVEHFILNDVGPHTLDIARFLFGEMSTVACTTHRIDPRIKGEDVATVLLESQSSVTVMCELSYATRMEHESFPETLALVEADQGSAVLTYGGVVRVTTRTGTEVEHVAIPEYPWADPAYASVHASIVDCNRNLLTALRGQGPAETTAADNLRTLQLVDAAYRSAASGTIVSASGA
jgi:predicted dehydrogenase